MSNDDRTDRSVDERLTAAGARLRADAPDAAATRQALDRLHASAPVAGASTSDEAKAWVPFLWAGIAATAAALITLVVLANRGPQETIREIPADSTPVTVQEVPQTTAAPSPQDSAVPTTAVDVGPASTTPQSTDPPPPSSTLPADPEAPTVFVEFRDDRCFVASLDAPDRRIGRAMGCIPADALVGDRLFLTLMEGELYRVAADADRLDAAGRPELTIQPFPEWSSASCGLIDAFPPEPEPGHSASALVMELVACSGGERPVALASRIFFEEATPPEYFTTGSAQVPGGAELTGPVPVDGLIGVDAYYATPLPSVRCVAVTQLPPGSEWREQCWPAGDEPRPAVTSINGSLVQLDLADETALVASFVDLRGVPFTGCAGADLETIVPAVLATAPDAMLTAMRCDDTTAFVFSGGALLQNGRPDGGFDEFERTDRSEPWTSLGGGTGLEAPRLYELPTHASWSPWLGDTPVTTSDRTGLTFGGTSGVAATNVEGITGLLEEDVDPEFPPNPTVVGVWPNTGIPSLVVVRVDVGGDDSVSGLVHYVQVAGGPNEYRVVDWFTASVCARGTTPDVLCV